MKVRISYTVTVDDEIRRAINVYYGKEGLATRGDVQDFYRINGNTLDDDIISEYDTTQERLDASLTPTKERKDG